MELLLQEQLRSLIKPTEPPCVSIFLPTHRGGAETRQGPIRLKNQIKQAEEQISRQGVRNNSAKPLLEPLQKLCENSGFWQYQSDGLALFRSPEKFLYYRLPMHFDELVVVTDRFHVKPLLRMFTEDGRYYLLALSRKEVRFFQCTRYGVREIALPEGTPRSLDQVLELEGVQRQHQIHTAGAATKFHGHGGRVEDEKQDVIEFFRFVDRGVKEVVRGDRAPLVLAGVEYLLPLYRDVSTYPDLIEKWVTGNPDGRRPEDLQSNSWVIVEPYFRRIREEAARQFSESSGSSRASSDIRQVVPAALQGRVEKLFVAVGKQIWGLWDEPTQKVEMHEEKTSGDRDLLDLAAIQTLLQGGAVYAVPSGEVPGGGLLAAVLRY